MGKPPRNQNIMYRPDPRRQPFARKPEKVTPMDERSKIDKAFRVDSFLDEDYVREVPAIYAEDKDDLLMRSIIEKYALEGRGEDGKPTG